MKTAVIFNPIGGHGTALKILPRINSWAKANKIDFDFFSTHGTGDGFHVARFCLLEKYKRVVAVGGDGTMNEVGSAIVGTDIVMGVLPGGTGNDFYKQVGMNGNFSDACKVAFLGKGYEIDVGTINDKNFMNSVGVGFDAEVAARADKSDKTGGILTYIVSVFKTLKDHKPREFEIELDNYNLKLETTLVCVGNGRSSGGGFYLTPHANSDDGLLDVCIIDYLPKSKVIQYLPRTLNGSHIRLDGVSIYRSRKVVIKSLTPPPVHIDGEIYRRPGSEIEFGIDNRKLLLAMNKVKSK